MKINPRVIYLSIVFTVLVVMASNIAVADALGAGNLAKVASNVTSNSEPVFVTNSIFSVVAETDHNLLPETFTTSF